MNGVYVDNAVHGVCTYKASVNVFVDLTSVITTAGQKDQNVPVIMIHFRYLLHRLRINGLDLIISFQPIGPCYNQYSKDR